jgi:2-methylisocitrate lyase-like PEP mutase family enzyme
VNGARSTTRYRRLIENPRIAVSVGAYDALSARLVEAGGFDLTFVHDFGVSAGKLALPDLGLVTLSEMTDVIANVVKAVDIPVIADAGCGFGNPLTTYRTVLEYERAGAAGINLEDQVYPKRCGHLAGKEVVSPTSMVERIVAAVDARRDPDFVITARVDSLAIHGVDDAIARGNTYLDAGADMIFVEAPTTEEEVRAIVGSVKGPSWVNMVEGGRTPLIPTRRLQEMGAALVDYGPLVLFAAAAGMRKALEVLRRDGTTAAHLDQLMTFGDFTGLLRIDEMTERAAGFARE